MFISTKGLSAARMSFARYVLRRSARGWAALSCFAIAMFAAVPAQVFAQQAKLSIDSMRVLTITPDFVDMEVAGLYDGSLGQLFLGVIAKSRDGDVRSSGYTPAVAPADKQFRILVRVLRPDGRAKQQTDYLMANVYPPGQDAVLRRKFTWPHVWPEKQAGGKDEPEQLSAEHPWQAFYENLQEEDFTALDSLMSKWNTPRERDIHGEWKLDSFRSVFLNFSHDKRDWKGDLQRISRWRAFNPKSAGAAIAEAKYWAAYAWHIRGNAIVAQTDPVALRVFAERMRRAEQVLKEAKDFSADNPLWYEAYLDIAPATKRDDKFIEVLFNEAIRKHPYFQPLYLDMAKYWAPQSGENADWKKVDEVIKLAASNTAGTDGNGNYAMLYAQLGELQKCECNLFDDSSISWPRMRDSFEDLVKRYPSVNNLNQFAAFACRAGDKRTFLNIRPRIIGHIVPSKWLDGYSYDLCDHRFMQNT